MDEDQAAPSLVIRDYACRDCKRQKRRCDKRIPTCGLCLRNGRLCEYGEPPQPTPTACDFAALSDRLSKLETQLTNENTSSLASSNRSRSDIDQSSSINRSLNDVTASDQQSSLHDLDELQHISCATAKDFPAALFLDIDLFFFSRLRLPSVQFVIPMEVLALLSHGNTVVDTCNEYFSTIHTWLPIVSKKRMDLGISLQSPGPDMAMLFLAMRLLVATADEVTENDLYSIAKGFLAKLEMSGTISLLHLQAMVLVALYEYGQCVYPAAWMTIGGCARYAVMLGFSASGNTTILGQPTTWTEAEERIRAWWAIFILDRLVSMGGRRSCSLPEPPPDGRLPADDEAWDAGEVGLSLNQSVSTHLQVHQASFARLCQAAIQVDRAMTYARRQGPISAAMATDIVSFSREISNFGSLLDDTTRASTRPNNRLGFLAGRLLTRSAVYIALDVFTCPDKVEAGTGYVQSSSAKSHDELGLQVHAMQVIQSTSQHIYELSKEVLSLTDIKQSQNSRLGNISPFVLDAIYAAISTFHWLAGESGGDAYQSRINDLEAFMDEIGARWGLSNQYRQNSRLYSISARIHSLRA